MIKINFTGEWDEVKEGVINLQAEMNFSMQESGYRFVVSRNTDRKIHIKGDGNKVEISYDKKFMFFRALSLALQELFQGKYEFELEEYLYFDTNGVMFDTAQGYAALNVKYIKRLIRLMATMGLNMLMIYTEDNYELEGEPYFGYMRPKYTLIQWRECDAYAEMFGIDMIPCIQTLAHLGDFLKWSYTSAFRDDHETLLVGCDKTYELIEKMLSQLKGVFRTNRIHLGMDEAWQLGLGNYLRKNGFHAKFDIMSYHLDRVMAIAEKYGYEPMIWSDMFYRAGSATGSYHEPEIEFPDSVLKRFPDDLQLVYWDYDTKDPEKYIKMIQSHRKFGKDPIFAGGIWGWSSYSVHYQRTFDTTNAALIACKRAGIKEVFATIWGDCGAEANLFTNILGIQLFAEHSYHYDVNESLLKKNFEHMTGGKYDDFLDIEYINRFDKTQNDIANCSKTLMWQDVFMGLFDWHIKDIDTEGFYQHMAKKMNFYATRNKEWNYIFDFLTKVCHVLSVKSSIGLKLKKAYDEMDICFLKNAAFELLPELQKSIKDLKNAHLDIWMEMNHPVGWELFDIKYGGVIMRIDTAIKRLTDYIERRINTLEELEQEKLPFTNKDLPNTNSYDRIISGSRIVM